MLDLSGYRNIINEHLTDMIPEVPPEAAVLRESMEYSLKVGGKETLTVTQTGANSTKQLYCTAKVPLLTYKTDNKNVATVDSNGVITATGAGYCVVYVQAVDGLWRSVSVVVEDNVH